MSKWKKVLALALALVMVLALAGYRSRGESDKSTESAESAGKTESGDSLSDVIASRVAASDDDAEDAEAAEDEEDAGDAETSEEDDDAEDAGDAEDADDDAEAEDDAGDEDEDAGVLTIHAQVPESWGTPGVWAWSEFGGEESWPGTLMDEGEGWYDAEVPDWVRYILIASDGVDVFKTAGVALEADTAELWITVSPEGEVKSYAYDPTEELNAAESDDFAALVGVWSADIDCIGHIEEVTDAVVGDVSESVQLSDYIEHFYVPVLWQINEDYSYSISVDTEELEGRVQELREGLYYFFYDAAVQSVKDALKEQGVMDVSEKTLEALEELLGTSMEVVLESSLGMDLESYVDSYVSESDLLSGLNTDSSGTLEARDGKLFYDGDEESYNTYVFTVLTITGDSQGEADSYPMDFYRVA